MKKLLKSIFVIISVVCIVFSAFFVYSYASGNTKPITMIEAGIIKIANKGSHGSSSKVSTVTMLTDEYGLSTSQAGKVVSIAEELGVDTSDPAEFNNFVAKNAANADEIREISAAVQAGMMTEAQAKAQLENILDV